MAPAVAGTCDWDTDMGWVARENLKPGSAKWDDGAPVRMGGDFSRRVELKRIEGWFGTTSAQCGQNVALRLVGGSKEIETKISIYRMGYYGGARARLIAVEKTFGNLWKFEVSQKTPPGQYLFRLDADRRKTSFVPLVIRDAKSKSAITFVSSVLTWQMNNKWGGSAPTFNRPYDGDGAGQFRYTEFPALYLAERAGHEINYITDLDLDSTSVDRGINLVSLGANTGYNRVTYDLETRTVSNVIRWRDPTVRKSESHLLGSHFFAYGVKSNYTVKSGDQWPFSVLKEGEKIVGVVGPAVSSPVKKSRRVGVEILAQSSPVGDLKMPAIATYYTRPSGSGILNIGTSSWVCAIDNKCPGGNTFSITTKRQVAAVTGAIFEGITRGPLAKWRPATIDIPAQP